MGMYYGGGSHSTQGPPSYRVWGGEGEARAPTLALQSYIQSNACRFLFSPISVLLRQPLSIKKSYAGAVQSKNHGKRPHAFIGRIFVVDLFENLDRNARKFAVTEVFRVK